MEEKERTLTRVTNNMKIVEAFIALTRVLLEGARAQIAKEVVAFGYEIQETRAQVCDVIINLLH